MNIMLVSVRERTREIGIRKAIGATYGNILSQFLIESITLSALGGVIGILLGFFCAAIVSKAFSNIPTQVTWWSVIVAFAVSGSLGVFFGVYPAHRAATLDPIVALRYE